MLGVSGGVEVIGEAEEISAVARTHQRLRRGGLGFASVIGTTAIAVGLVGAAGAVAVHLASWLVEVVVHEISCRLFGA